MEDEISVTADEQKGDLNFGAALEAKDLILEDLRELKGRGVDSNNDPRSPRSKPELKTL